jgi:hypothetical protein
MEEEKKERRTKQQKTGRSEGIHPEISIPVEYTNPVKERPTEMRCGRAGQPRKYN